MTTWDYNDLFKWHNDGCQDVDINILIIDSSFIHICNLSIPKSITKLYVNNENIRNVINPATRYLLASYYQYEELPILHEGLIELNCEYNRIKVLHKLPLSLKALSCECNQLEELPLLHEGLIELYCYKNQIKVLPKLPSTLELLVCKYNYIKILPIIPKKCMIVCDLYLVTHTEQIPYYHWDHELFCYLDKIKYKYHIHKIIHLRIYLITDYI